MSDTSFYQDGFMDLTGYSLERAALDEKWDALVESSPQGTLFSTSLFLSCLQKNKPGTWYCKKNNQIVAGLVVSESPDGLDSVADDLIIYGGLLFKPKLKEQSDAQSISEKFRISAFIAEELEAVYQKIFLSMSPNIDDLRPFLWHNWDKSGSKWNFDLRYTSVHDLSKLDPNGPIDTNPVYLGASKSRRQQIRYGIKKRVVGEKSSDVKRFLELYKMTFDRQNEPQAGLMENALGITINKILDNGMGEMYFSSAADGRLGSAAVFGWDNKRAYYLYGANDPSCRNEHTGSMVLWYAILDLASREIKSVDMEGINSPLRGHFKLSFGGNIVPYYHLSLKGLSNK